MNQFRTGQSELYFAPGCLLGLLHDARTITTRWPKAVPYSARENSAPALQPHLPHTAFHMLDVWLAHLFQTLVLNQLRDPGEACSVVFGS